MRFKKWKEIHLKSLSLSFAAAVVATVAAFPAAAAEASPVGLWRTFDASTKYPRSIVRVAEVNGELTARIEKIFAQAGENPNPICRECEGDRKDQPLLGMTILWGLKKDGDTYGGGHVVDPKSGKSYKSKVTLLADGEQLKVLGYIGVPMMGRSQIWVREK
jgi:uncharacterized protein (DUF2147 family)